MNTFDSLAKELLVSLNSKTKLPSLFPQLEPLGPLLDQKFGGRLGNPRLLLVRDEHGCVFHSRMPNDFFGGEYASWEKLTRRDSTELRKHLICLLNRWIDTESEFRPEPPRRLTFREQCEKASTEFAGDGQDAMLRFFSRRWRLFEAAFDLVFSDSPGKAPAELATLLQKPMLKDDDHLWSKWPCVDNFITFASYRYASNSALGIAERFVESVCGAVQYGKLKALSRFDERVPDDDEVVSWWHAAREQARDTTLCLDEWSMAEVFRDREILEIRAELERQLACLKHSSKVNSLAKIHLSLWDKKLLLAMFNLKTFNGHYLSSRAICGEAQHPSCHKTSFDNLKRMKLVTKPPNGKGRMLTEAGLAFAKGLSEQ